VQSDGVELHDAPGPLNDNDGLCRCGGKVMRGRSLCLCCAQLDGELEEDCSRARRPCGLWAPCCCPAASNGHCYLCGWRREEH
jgi:hypothetical protein